jgi:hypothetical protein
LRFIFGPVKKNDQPYNFSDSFMTNSEVLSFLFPYPGFFVKSDRQSLVFQGEDFVAPPYKSAAR